jgi:hypothetical protein
VSTYNIARDGHPYLTRGYPIVDKRGREDVRFCTYQLNPRAEHLFEKLRFEDGEIVPRETFYALLVEGDLFNDPRPNGIEISSVPKNIVNGLEDAARQYQLKRLLNQPKFVHAPYLIDVFEILQPQYEKTSDALCAASWFSLLRHSRRHAANPIKNK